MASKLLWLGLTIILVTGKGIFFIPAGEIVGAILMIVGVVLLLLDK